MRTSGVRLGRVFDIEISADLGVVMFAGLLTWILASSILPASVAGLPAGAYWSVAALGTLLFLGSIGASAAFATGASGKEGRDGREEVAA